MISPLWARAGLCALAMLAIASGAACRTLRETDEAAIRRAFAIPAGARATRYAATPADSGWFGREGLKVDMAFALDDADARTFRTAAAADPAWQPLPISDALLRRMAAIETARRGLARVYADRHEPLPPDGSVYNPSEPQLLARFVQSLPPAPVRGRFQVRTAGNDIMHASTTAVLTADRDLADFMLAMLDEESGRLVVKVSTRY